MENAVDAGLILRTEGLSKQFRGLRAVDDVSLRIRRGSIHALIGPNGAGKTTCFNLLTGFLAPTGGRIFYKERDITRLPPAEVARLGLGRSFQISSIFARATVLENIRLALQRKRGDSFDFYRSDRALGAYEVEAEKLAGMVGLQDHLQAPAGALPYGRRRALEIATTLALDPELLLLDEPSSGMGQEDVERITDLIRSVAVGRTVLIVEHNLPMVASLSDCVTVLARGSVLAEGRYADVAADDKVVEAYIGGGYA
ncbi:MAG: transporter ATP-binding protein [Ramlibacter sp.]|jgi:branched-chain amino acid transport system ATP-binding protein|nr:transporter ATP-binding protein [Ramlibacter sp.]